MRVGGTAQGNTVQEGRSPDMGMGPSKDSICYYYGNDEESGQTGGQQTHRAFHELRIGKKSHVLLGLH